MNTATLLPDPSRFRLECLSSSATTLTILVSSVQTTALCPLCGIASGRIHSHYVRTIADLPWNQIAVRLQVRAHKFFCDYPFCERRIFTEPLPNFAERYARKTLRLNDAFYLLGYVLGGEAGARVAVELGLSVSPDTLLNRVRQVGTKAIAEQPVRVLGVDDFAFRKGLRYGTILVDLERRKILDLLPDRTAQSLADWLMAHPGIEVISRDRASAYADAARQAAPQAQQVADRWHLLKNAGDMLERLLIRHYKHLRETAQHLAQKVQNALPLTAPELPASIAPRPFTRQEQDSACRRERRLAVYEQVRELQKAGMGLRAIARKTGISRNTLRKWLDAGCFREQAKRYARSSKLAPFTDYLQKRWNEECTCAVALFDELKAQGFTGSLDIVQRYVQPWRTALKSLPRKHREEPPSSRTVLWWLLGHFNRNHPELRQKQTDFVEHLCQISPEIKAGQELTVRFTTMIKQRDTAAFSSWLEDAADSGIAELKGFAKSLRQDITAVKAALETAWSNGQTEGQVNRLKLVKRSMYGRAKFDLLKARVLPQRKAA